MQYLDQSPGKKEKTVASFVPLVQNIGNKDVARRYSTITDVGGTLAMEANPFAMR
jgi:hypothetical protein